MKEWASWKTYTAMIFTNFFKDMPIEMQQEVIDKLNRQIKKPPDHDESESEVVQISELSVK